jgi:hypothetical protein
MSEKEDRELVVRCSDFHVPYHDEKAISCLLSFLAYIQPKILVIDEVIDFYSISRYDKDPSRKLDLQRDINKSIKILESLRKAIPKAKIVMVESNHDKRLKKYLNSRAEELSCLDCLNFNNLLDLNRLNIEYRKDFMFRGVLFKHGSIVRQHSSYTAKAEMERENVSGCSGHTHRLGLHFKTQRGGSFVWMETGCLCKTKNVEYIDGTSNWQTGFAMFDFKKDSNRFYPIVIPIIDNEIMFGRRTFK